MFFSNPTASTEGILMALENKHLELSLNHRVAREIEDKKRNDFDRAKKLVGERFHALRAALQEQEAQLLGELSTMEMDMVEYLTHYQKEHELKLSEIKDAAKAATERDIGGSPSLPSLLRYKIPFNPPIQRSNLHFSLSNFDPSAVKKWAYFGEETGVGTKRFFDLRVEQEMSKIGPPDSNSYSNRDLTPRGNDVKVLIVGDVGSGKTSMLMRMLAPTHSLLEISEPSTSTTSPTTTTATRRNSSVQPILANQPLEDLGSTPFEVYELPFDCYKHHVKLVLYDLAGDDELRQLARCFYKDADVVLLCFNCSSPDYRDRIENVWVSEIREHALLEKGPPILLVGTHSDVDQKKSGGHYSKKEATELAWSIGAVGYHECSSKTDFGIQHLLLAAVEASGRLSEMRAK